jgi:DNA-binding LacI/PurR family transcriptional regulator
MLKKAGVSYVALFSSPSVADCDSVVLDDYAGVTEAMRYLFSLGHRSIAFCRAVEGEHIHPREQAYRQCMEQSGLPILPHFLVPNISDAREAGLQVMEKVFQTEPVPTAIFAGNDQTALLCVKFLNALGKRIPRDISVVGFDNLRFTEHLSVPLTTVDQPKREMGRRAVEMLLERLELGIAPEPRVERFRPHLVIRDSCGISPLPENSLSDRTAELASL